MSYSRFLHKMIDSDLVAQIQSHGKVRNRNKSLVRGLGGWRSRPTVKLRPFHGAIRKNQKRDAYF